MMAPEELADLRVIAEDSLEGLCSVERIVRIKLPNNSWKDVQQQVMSDVPCRKVYTGRSPVELAITGGQQQENKLIAVFLVPSDLAIYSDDIIVYEGKSYPVVGVENRTAGMYGRIYVYDDSKAAAA